MKIYASICHDLVLTHFWPKVVSWRFEISTDENPQCMHDTMAGYTIIFLHPYLTCVTSFDCSQYRLGVVVDDERRMDCQ